jgi:hypothetical protein
VLTVVRRGAPTREKPPEIVRGYSCRLPWAWDGLCFGVPFNDPTRDSARDIVANIAPSAVTGLVWGRDNRGNAVAYLNNTSWIDYPDNPVYNRPSTAITAYARIRLASASWDAYGGIFSKRMATNDWSTWCIQGGPGASSEPPSGNILSGFMIISGGWHYFENTGYFLDTTAYVSTFLRWSTGTAPRLDILGERGQILASAVSPNGAATGTLTYTSNEPVRINAIQNNTLNYNADYSQVLLWNRALSDTELQALVADPFGWYSPRRETVGLSSPYPLGFGAGEMKFGTSAGGLL